MAIIRYSGVLGACQDTAGARGQGIALKPKGPKKGRRRLECTSSPRTAGARILMTAVCANHPASGDLGI